jgi:hypothetical protein
MKADAPTDYKTYREIAQDLILPIRAHGLDADTQRRLYSSKLVYLESLRLHCFRQMNLPLVDTFTIDDYQWILLAQALASKQLTDIVRKSIQKALSRYSFPR